jgi:hypothetical protein
LFCQYLSFWLIVDFFSSCYHDMYSVVSPPGRAGTVKEKLLKPL